MGGSEAGRSRATSSSSRSTCSEPHGYGEVRAGRFVLATGAILPVQLDGAEAIGRLPSGSTVETFGGVPVVPRFGPRAYDWLAGGRVAQSIASRATVGVSYVQRREDGEIADEELGADLRGRAGTVARRRGPRAPTISRRPGIADALVVGGDVASTTGASSSSPSIAPPRASCRPRRSSRCSATFPRRASAAP